MTNTHTQLRRGYSKRRCLLLVAGFCLKCGEERGASGTQLHCRRCANRIAARRRKRTAGLQRDGLCATCTRLRGADGTKWFCRRCANQLNAATGAIQQARLATGRCRACDAPRRANRTRCDDCLANCNAVYHRKRKERN